MIAIVTGVPASGKSTLAAALSHALQWPVLSKDVIKEAVFDSIGDADRAAVSRAASEVIWRLLPHVPSGAIVDIWFDPQRDAGVAAAALKRSGVTSRVVEIRCQCPGEVAVARYSRRTRSSVHLTPDSNVLERIRRSATLMADLGIGPSLVVDSTVPFDIARIVEWIQTKGDPADATAAMTVA